MADNGVGAGGRLTDWVSLSVLALGPAAPARSCILFVSGPWRSAILLVAGDKSGKCKRWYAEAIPHAEQLYEIYRRRRSHGAWAKAFGGRVSRRPW